MTQTEILTHLEAFDLGAVREVLSHAPDPEDGSSKAGLIDETVAWVSSLHRDLLALVREIGDGDDLEMAVAIQYVEMKSRWIAFNTKINYEVFRRGVPNLVNMTRGSAVSQLLAHIEPLLRAADIEHITEFLAQPLNEAA